MKEAVQRVIETTKAALEVEMSTFLEDWEIIKITGKRAKGKQIDQLRRMGMPFLVNATGHPVVTRSALEGRREAPQPVKQAWVPRVLKAV